jgi:hypothetical protein
MMTDDAFKFVNAHNMHKSDIKPFVEMKQNETQIIREI